MIITCVSFTKLFSDASQLGLLESTGLPSYSLSHTNKLVCMTEALAVCVCVCVYVCVRTHCLLDPEPLFPAVI